MNDFFFTAGQALKMKSRVNVDIYMNEGQDSEMSNTVHIVKHYEVRQGWVFIFCCRWTKYVHSCTEAVVMPYAVPLPQVVMCRGADITPKTHTAHTEIHIYTRTR